MTNKSFSEKKKRACDAGQRPKQNSKHEDLIRRKKESNRVRECRPITIDLVVTQDVCKTSAGKKKGRAQRQRSATSKLLAGSGERGHKRKILHRKKLEHSSGGVLSH